MALVNRSNLSRTFVPPTNVTRDPPSKFADKHWIVKSIILPVGQETLSPICKDLHSYLFLRSNCTYTHSLVHYRLNGKSIRALFSANESSRDEGDKTEVRFSHRRSVIYAAGVREPRQRDLINPRLDPRGDRIRRNRDAG